MLFRSEAFQLTIRAFNLAEKYRTLVVLLMDEVLGHMREAVTLPDLSTVRVINRIKPNVPPQWYKHYDENQKYLSPIASYGDGYRFHVTGLTHDDHGFPTNKPNEAAKMMERLDKKIKHNIRDLVQIETVDMEDAKVAVFAAGIMGRASKEAVKMARAEGMQVGLLRPLTIWPFPDDAVKKMLKDVKAVVVPELNQGQLFHELERLVRGRDDGRLVRINRNDGTVITPAEILKKIKEVYND